MCHLRVSEFNSWRKKDWSWCHDVNGLSSRRWTPPSPHHPGEILQRVGLLLAACARERMMCPTYFPFSVWEYCPFFAAPSFFGGNWRHDSKSFNANGPSPASARGRRQEQLLTDNKSLGFVFARYRMSPSISVFSFSPIGQEKASVCWIDGQDFFLVFYFWVEATTQSAFRSHHKSVTFSWLLNAKGNTNKSACSFSLA